MAEKYWETDAFITEMDGLQEPLAIKSRIDDISDNSAHIAAESVPEWWWVDADENELRVYVHQTYLQIAQAGQVGNELSYVSPEISTESRFVADPSPDSTWASLIADTNSIFRPINDDNFNALNGEATAVLAELNSIVSTVQWQRYRTKELTPQLLAPYWGNIGLGGYLSGEAKKFIQLQAGEADTTVDYPPATQILRALGSKAFRATQFHSAVGVESDGRFTSNTALLAGTGSLMVLPEETYYADEQRGYQYTSHNLDSEFTQLWAFCGLAKLLGDAHRYYDSLVEQP
jgi:hypothetical protein